MTGPEHYLEAEKILADVPKTLANNDGTNPAAALLIAEAQAHATLALAAATAIATPNGEYSSVDDREWYESAGLRSVKNDEGRTG